jgi:hypothetical protein
MPAVKRWAFNLFCLFSLLIFAASVAIWVRSYFKSETAEYWWNSPALGKGPGQAGVAGWGLGMRTGALFLWRLHIDNASAYTGPRGWSHRYSAQSPITYSPIAPGDQFNFKGLGFQFRRSLSPFGLGQASTFETIIPLWLFLPFAIPPILWWRKRRTNRGRGFPVEQVAKAA